MSKPYWQRLRNPLWQKKRLEVLSEAGFQCNSCPNTGEEQLHVHHEFYEKGAEPWDAPEGTLVSLCDPCHEEREQIEHDLKLELGRICALLTNKQLSQFASEIIKLRPLVEEEISTLLWDEFFSGIRTLTEEDFEWETECRPYQWIWDNLGRDAAVAFARRERR